MENVKNLVSSMDIQEGDVVLLQLWGENDQLETLDQFCIEIAALNATPLKLHHSREHYKRMFENSPSAGGLFNDAYFSIFEPVTVVIDLMAYMPAVPHTDFPKDKMEAYMKYMEGLFTALSNKRAFIQLRLPAKGMANELGMDYWELSNILNSAYSTDYSELKNRCKIAVEKLKDSKTLKIVTGDDCELEISLEGREWFLDGGNGDYPSGEVYIAPIESLSNGKICIEEMLFDGNSFGKTALSFSEGRLITSSNDKFNDVLKQLPEGGNVLCEFGIGLNPSLSKMSGVSVFDEKILGTIHIGLGMNMMFGGENGCPFHTDIVFVGDVYDGDIKLIENGKLL